MSERVVVVADEAAAPDGRRVSAADVPDGPGELRSWLAVQLVGTERLIVIDPRLPERAEHWRSAVEALEVRTAPKAAHAAPNRGGGRAAVTRRDRARRAIQDRLDTAPGMPLSVRLGLLVPVRLVERIPAPVLRAGLRTARAVRR